MTGPDANAQGTSPAVSTHPLLGVAGALLGALIATCAGRLMSVGLSDIRGGLHIGVDVGSWIDTTFNASMMFIAPYSRFLGLQHAFGSHSTGFTAVVWFVVVSFMSKVPTQYRQVTAAPVEAK